MSLQSEILRLQTSKAAIKDSVAAKGVDIPDTATVDEYADYIMQITTMDESFYIGANTVTTLASLPVSKQSVGATLSAATNISLSSDLNVGQCLNIRCTASASFTQPLPNSGAWSSMSGDSFSVESADVFELNIWCHSVVSNTKHYSIKVLTQG